MEKTIELLSQAKSVLILPHIKPDGDALGSARALCCGLISLGKKAWVLTEDPPTAKYAFMLEGLDVYDGTSPDLIVAVDCASESMLGERYARFLGGVGLCIDHHPSNTGYAGHTLLDVEAAATGEIVFDIVQTMGMKLSVDGAKSLYTALATDTGCFRFSNTTPRTFAVASRLLEVAGSVDEINYRFFSCKTKAQLAAQRIVLDSLYYFAGGRGAAIVIDSSLYEATGATDDDVEMFSQLPREIEGVEVGVTYKQCSLGGWRISLRSNGRVDASALCARFGGGGHTRAAGASIDGPLNEVKAMVEAAAEEELIKANERDI